MGKTSFKYKKTLVPKGQEFDSCGTTQIGEKRPLVLRTSMRTPLITDRVPVGAYSPRISGRPLEAIRIPPVLPHSHRQRLSSYTRRDLLFSITGLFDWLRAYRNSARLSSPVWLHPAQPLLPVSPLLGFHCLYFSTVLY